METAIGNSSNYRTVLSAVLVGCGYYLGAKIAYFLATSADNIATIWPPNAVILAALLLTNRRHWWIYIFAMIPAFIVTAVQTGRPAETSMIYFSANCTEILVAAFVLKPILGDRQRFDRMRETMMFFFVAVLIAPAISAFIASLATLTNSEVSYWLSWRIWFLGNAIGHLTVTPVIILWVSSSRGLLKELSSTRVVERVSLFACLLVIGFYSLGTEIGVSSNLPALLYTPLPVLLWAAIRFGPRGICSVVFVVLLLAIWNTLNGRGPFVDNTPAENVLSLQLFLIAISIPTMLLGSLLSERKQAEKAFKDSEEKSLLLLNSTGEAIYGLDLQGNCTFCNPACLRLLGYEHESQLLGRNMHYLIHHTRPDGSHYPEDQCRIYMAFRQGKGTHIDDEVLWRADGSSFATEYRSFPIVREGKTTGSVVSFVDISQRKHAQTELRQLQEKLAHVARVNTMGEMATGLAHELNQPLTAISTYCYVGQQSLADSDSEESVQLRELFEKLSQQAMRSGEIIRRLRSLVGRRESVRSLIDINEPIQEVLRLLDSDFRQSTVDVELLMDHSSQSIVVDEIQIQQVLVNLLQNALDAMNDTSNVEKSLKISTTQTADNLIEVCVSDTGRGIAVESVNRVFDAFFSSKSQGMGMGLAISRTIVESHGGNLWLTPNSDRGVTFHFTLPIAADRIEKDDARDELLRLSR